MKVLVILLGVMVISIGIGNHALVATATGETVNCGNGFTPVAALNFFRDIESIRAQCAQQNSSWKLYAWSAIGLGAAMLLGGFFIRTNR